MKKLVALMIILCLLFTGAIAYFQGAASVEKPDAIEQAEPAEAIESIELKSEAIDYEAIYKLHQPDEIVMTINGKDITWAEYFYYYYYYANTAANQLDMMAVYYEMNCTWDDVADTEGHTYAEIPAASALVQLKKIETILGYAEENGVELNEEDKAEYEEALKSDIASVCGENGTQEDFDKVLEDMYMNMDIYRRMTESNIYYTRNMVEVYGEDGEKISDEDAVAYLEANEYVTANHILLMTTDSETGETVDEDTKIAIRKQAEEIAAELQGIEDVNERTARFLELAAEYNEDPGMEYYPNGYTYTPGTMVTEFEKAVESLGDYDVSDPVETTYGYHIIMRMPLTADALLTGESTPTPVRIMMAADEYTSALDNIYSDLKIEYAEGFEAPNIKDYIG